MRYLSKLSLLAALGAFLLGMPSTVTAQVSTCDQAIGEKFLDVNSVRAMILNNGGLFWRGGAAIYEVPKGGGVGAIFAGGIWVTGQVDGQLRAAASLYGPWEFWAGPLDDNGAAPDDCSIYDQLYKVSKIDVEAFDLKGESTPDLAAWPTGLGAPTLDANGDKIDVLSEPLLSRKDRVIDLAGGERPDLLGDQMIWWVMNDRGNQHNATDAPAIGLEVHGSAFAFDVSGDIGNTTFYKYRIFYKGNVPLTESYLTIWSDPDLGDFTDDYVGSDTSLGMGFVYNSDNADGAEYGTPPPAAGYDFFQGPIVPSPGDTAHVSGVPRPDFKNLGMTAFSFWNNTDNTQGGPREGRHFYNYAQGRWRDGERYTIGGSGLGFSEEVTNFMFPGDPATESFWSEINPRDGVGPPITAADRRFAMSTGPFTINPGDEQEIVYGLVWAIGADNLDSVAKLRTADAFAQAAFDVNFELPDPPARPTVNAVVGDRSVVIEWTNGTTSNNYLESYVAIDPLVPPEDADYVFEGYRVIRYTEVSDQTGTVVATYDVVNGITRVIEGPPGELNQITADGSDRGVQHTHFIGGLTNSKTHYYGVQAYAYNEASNPKVFNGNVARFEFIPRNSEDVYSNIAEDAAADATQNTWVVGVTPGTTVTQAGQGVVAANVESPGSMVDAEYTTFFYRIEGTGKRSTLAENSEGPQFDDYPIGYDKEDYAAKSSAVGDITYDITRSIAQQTAETVFDGNLDGEPAPQRKNVILIDGLAFSVTGPAPGMIGFKMIANAAGPLDPPDMAAYAFNSSGFPTVDGKTAPERGYGQSTNDSRWGVNVGGGNGDYGDEAGPFNSGSTWVGRSIREGSEANPWPNVGSDNYEWRFTSLCDDNADGTVTEGGCVGWRGFEDGALVGVPFQLWNTGTTDDTSDDYRMLPLICESGCEGVGIDGIFDIFGDHPISGGDDDPLTDWIYWYKPEDNGAVAGEQGYMDFFFGPADTGVRVFSRQVLVSHNNGTAAPYDPPMAETGSIIKYETKKPNQPGDTFTFNTVDYGTEPASDSLKVSRLARMNVVPNPYLGASDYERSQLVDEVRFSNMPLEEEATVRVYTLNGQLIVTMFKPAGINQLSWNLTTENNLPIGSGLYLIHVEVPGVGTRVIKFAAVKKRIQLNVF